MSNLIKLHESDYIPKFKKRSMKWENTLTLGLELELENNHPYSYDDHRGRRADLKKVDEFLQKDKSCVNPFYYKTDASLDNGVEFVTQPLTLQYFHNNANIKQLFDFMKKETKFYNKSNCGIHVHLSRDFFTKQELVKLRIFFSVNKSQLHKFSRRSNEKISRWAKLETDYNVKNFLKGDREKNDRMEESKTYACCFQTKNNKTIEIRLFASTTDNKRLTAILQFCDAMAYFIKTSSIVGISKQDCWKTFTNWCEQTNRYCHFIEELENLQLIT